MNRQRIIFLLIITLVLAVIGGIFVMPKGLGAKYRPWRLGLDLVGGSHLVYEVDMSKVDSKDRDSVLSGLRDVIEKRINLFGVSEPRVTSAQQGDSHRLIVELAGIKDVSEAVKQIGLTPFLDFREVVQKPSQSTSTILKDENVDFVPTQLNGRYVKSAQLDIDQTTGATQVAIQFSDEGGKIFEELTAKNVGKQLAIFLDNNLVSAPTVREKISGGKAVITGNFTPDEAKQMVQRFNAGALPAPINLISQQTIGASLGQDSLKKALYAGFIGTILIIIFLIFYYRKYGVFAAFALFIYIVLTAAIFKLFVVMSLAGIAGFVLSIGMAVDANVLVFERVKEEMKKGLLEAQAIEEGFKRAWASIRDSNISTIITSVILYEFTSSFVKGFALTLLIGVLMSMFSAITITKTFLRAFVKKQ
ncbi:MAG: protein translocase subunit SecD [Candidatus Wolfebacteria bacterium]|nr:protein translocase subunit SecD [Candidatus Wolfebacteria bacterium]